jgi:hypothetical protein
MPEEPAENRAQNKGGINENELNSCKRHFKSPLILDGFHLKIAILGTHHAANPNEILCFINRLEKAGAISFTIPVGHTNSHFKNSFSSSLGYSITH